MDIETICRTGNFERAREAALNECRQLTPAELEMVLAAAVQNSDFADADKILEKLGRKLSQRELDEMLEVRLRSGNLALATWPERWGRELTQEEKDRAVLIGLLDHNDTEQIVRVVSKGLVSKDCISKLIDLCIERALPNTAGFLAEKIGKKINKEEVDRLTVSCKQLGYEDRVHDALKLVPV